MLVLITLPTLLMPGHLNSVGGCGLASFAPTHVSGTACRPGSPLPPDTHTRQLQQGPAEVEGRRTWPSRCTGEFPSVRRLHLAQGQ